MTTIPFHKMHGLGNDFAVIDAIRNQIDLPTLPVQHMADRHLGIGFDQLLVIEKSDQADFFCRILNADGSEAEQCGNGLRCVARFIHETNLLAKKNFEIQTIAGVFPVNIIDYGCIMITIPYADTQASSVSVSLPDRYPAIEGIALSMGNPHFIIRVNQLSGTDVINLGSALSTHACFPQGTNVGFMEIVSPSHIRLRTHERGAGTTLACGSNACAAVIAGIKQQSLATSVTVEFEYGNVIVEWGGEGKPVQLTGPATLVYQGEWLSASK